VEVGKYFQDRKISDIVLVFIRADRGVAGNGADRVFQEPPEVPGTAEERVGMRAGEFR